MVNYIQEGEQGTQRSGGQTVAHDQHLHAPNYTRVWQETGLKVSWKTEGLQHHSRVFACLTDIPSVCVCVCLLGVIEEKGRERGRKESDQTQTQ